MFVPIFTSFGIENASLHSGRPRKLLPLISLSYFFLFHDPRVSTRGIASKYDLSFLCPGWSGVQFDWQNGQVRLEYRIRFVTNYLAFLASGVARGTRCPHHDCELTSCYHDAFLTWGHYHNNIVLFYHDSPITRSHFMDLTDRAKKGLYCTIADIWFPNLTMCAIAKIGGCTRIVQVRQTS